MRPEVKMGLSLLRATGSKLGTHAPVYLSVPAVWRCHPEGGSREGTSYGQSTGRHVAPGPCRNEQPHLVSSEPVTSVTSCQDSRL